jgi:pimeloyl-ACP methyl ester carboxylesterase
MEITSGTRHDFEQQYTVPVVFVPGIMGSRLRIHHNGASTPWEPDSVGQGSIVWNFASRSAQTKRNRLNPRHRTTFLQNFPRLSRGDLIRSAPPARLQRYQEDTREVGQNAASAYHAAPRMEQIMDEFESDVKDHLRSKGWNEVAWGFYGSFLVALQTASYRGGTCPVYAVGYDWRGSNAHSAERLHGRIEEIRDQESADQVAIITHSMGGLVTRSYIEQYGEDAVAGVIHVTQPTYGAPVLYRRFMTGGVLRGDGKDGTIALLFGRSRRDLATVLGVSDGALELLPTAEYRGQSVRHPRFPSWVSWDSGMTAGRSFQQPPQNLDDFYTESSGHIGIIPPNFQHRDDLKHRIGDALAFQRTIDRVYHRTTYWVCSDGETVDLAVRIEPLEYETNSYLFDQIHTRSVVEYEGPSESRAHDDEALGTRVIHFFPEGQSDGTVPDDSQHGYRMRPGPHPAEGVFQIHGVAHDQACNDDAMQTHVIHWINTMIAAHAASSQH